MEKVFNKLLEMCKYTMTFSTTSEWLKANDPNVYDTLLDYLEEFADDESNQCDEEDLQNFIDGNWEVEYVVTQIDDDEIEVSVTAGRNGQHIANQPAWLVENISLEDVKNGYTDAPLYQYLKEVIQ